MNIHPAIDSKEIDVWNACRQIQYPGAKVTVSNYSWESSKKGQFAKNCRTGVKSKLWSI